MSRKWNFLSLTILVLVICFFGEDYVEYVPGNGALEINPGDTSWMVVASAFVLLMTPGLAFFYGGMVDKKNVISTMLQSFVALGVISVLWVTVGFSLCFGDSVGGIVGNPMTHFAFNGVGLAPNGKFASTFRFCFLLCFSSNLPSSRQRSLPEALQGAFVSGATSYSWCFSRVSFIRHWHI